MTSASALAAAGLYCFYPSLVGATALVLTETLFTLLVVGFLVLVERYLACPVARTLAAAGLVLGLAALTRSVVWLFPPFAASSCSAWGARNRGPAGSLSAATLVLAFAVTLAPWTIRNTRLQQTFTTVDVMGGRNVMMGNYEYTPGLSSLGGHRDRRRTGLASRPCRGITAAWPARPKGKSTSWR